MMALMESRELVATDEEPPVMCPHCGAELRLHQPDCDLPTRLLATCEACKSWFLSGPVRDRLRWVSEQGRRRRRKERDN